jgi:hypothetical protein
MLGDDMVEGLEEWQNIPLVLRRAFAVVRDAMDVQRQQQGTIAQTVASVEKRLEVLEDQQSRLGRHVTQMESQIAATKARVLNNSRAYDGHASVCSQDVGQRQDMLGSQELARLNSLEAAVNQLGQKSEQLVEGIHWLTANRMMWTDADLGTADVITSDREVRTVTDEQDIFVANNVEHGKAYTPPLSLLPARAPSPPPMLQHSISPLATPTRRRVNSLSALTSPIDSPQRQHTYTRPTVWRSWRHDQPEEYQQRDRDGGPNRDRGGHTKGPKPSEHFIRAQQSLGFLARTDLHNQQLSNSISAVSRVSEHYHPSAASVRDYPTVSTAIAESELASATVSPRHRFIAGAGPYTVYTRAGGASGGLSACRRKVAALACRLDTISPGGL